MTSPSLVDRVRSAAASSLLVRAALLATLAISVTVGGVLAGALVVAPVVARASEPGTASQASRTITAFGTSALAASRELFAKSADVVAGTIATLPQPMTRYVLAGLGVLAIVGAMAPRFLRRRTPVRSATGASNLEFEGAFEDTSNTASSSPRLTPRSLAWTGKRHQTPRAVEALAASGASATDIAWKTGLPIDAVQLLLAISSGARQLQPPAA